MTYGPCQRRPKTERLNRARTLLREFEQLPDAVEQLAQDCSISPRQAYRYFQQAQPRVTKREKRACRCCERGTVTMAPLLTQWLIPL
jgi:hypothetical protein